MLSCRDGSNSGEAPKAFTLKLHILIFLPRVEPILYRDVIVDGKDCFHRTVTALESTKPPDFFANHVKSLLFEGNSLGNNLKAAEILEKCCSVRMGFRVTAAFTGRTGPLREFPSLAPRRAGLESTAR